VSAVTNLHVPLRCSVRLKNLRTVIRTHTATDAVCGADGSRREQTGARWLGELTARRRPARAEKPQFVTVNSFARLHWNKQFLSACLQH
jgi:hypothetical protein